MNLRGLLFAALLTAAAAHAQTPDEQARFLAGLPVNDGKLAALAATKSWQTHAASLDAAWAKMDRRQLLSVRGWAEAKIPEIHHGKSPVLYFFSGPDFLYAQTLFPNARTYVLCGIEGVGEVPDLTALPEGTVGLELDGLRGSLHTILKTHYFITKDMRTDLERLKLRGTLPLLYFFLARTGCAIREVTPLANGVRIEFHGPGGRQTLYYFKTDLANGGSHADFLKFCRGQAPAVSLVKSASYLMHGASFSQARDFLLQNSRVILQDDTGIPYRFFDPQRWQVRLYGAYFRHGDMFGKYDQPDLEAAYQSARPTALGFSFGYHWQRERGLLMVARVK